MSTASLVFIRIERFGREGEGVSLWHGVAGREVFDATCNKVVLGLRAYPGGKSCEKKREREMRRVLSPAIGNLLGERMVPPGLRSRTEELIDATRRTVGTSTEVGGLEGIET